MDKLQITAAADTRCSVVAATGEIDMASIQSLAQAVARTLSADRPLVLDLTGIEFIDSSGLWFLLKTHRDATALGTTLAIATSPALDRVLHLAELTDHLPTHPDRASAEAACAAPGG